MGFKMRSKEVQKTRLEGKNRLQFRRIYGKLSRL